MTLTQIAAVAATKVGRTDSFAVTTAQSFAQSRHEYVYDAFDWRSTQVTVTLPVASGVPIQIPGIDRVISVRYFQDALDNSKFLDPVSVEFLYETGIDLADGAYGDPRFYVELYDQSTQQRTITLYPSPSPLQSTSGANVTVLGKKAFDPTATAPILPHIDQLLIAYVTADLLETFKQVAKAQAKMQEADKLLADAQARDTPPITRPRMSKVLTVSGNSLEELTDSVCDIIGDWKLDTRISVKERVRRNYQTLWEMALWPESTVVARVFATDNEQIILPHYFDRVIEVRDDQNPTGTLRNQEVSIFFDVDKDIFERVGNPTDYTMLPPIGVSALPPYTENLLFFLGSGDFGGRLTRYPHFLQETAEVFVKGETDGAELSETVDVQSVAGGVPGPLFDTAFAVLPSTAFAYNTPITIAKPITRNDMTVYGASSKRVLLRLGAQERERKFMRLWLLPNNSANTDVTAAESYLVLGKRAISPLVADADTCQLRNVENILINGAAADMLDKMGNAALAATLRQKATAASQIMIDGETNQNANNPQVIPYVEGDSCGWDYRPLSKSNF
jgi:hypothetical protein